MKYFFTITAQISILLLLLFLNACTDKKAEDYNEKQSDFIEQLQINLQAGEYSQAISILKENDYLADPMLIQILQNYKKEIELLNKADSLLQNGHFNELNSLVESAEKQGEASPELLQYRAVPQALQALQLFCSRKPWEKAEDLQSAINWLKPYLNMLQKAQTFNEFWLAELQLRDELLIKETKNLEYKMLKEIDLLISEKKIVQAWIKTRSLQQQVPDNEIFNLVNPINENSEKALFTALKQKQSSSLALEIALMLVYNKLQTAEKNNVNNFLTNLTDCQSYSALLQKAELLDDPDLYLQAFQKWLTLENKNLPDFLLKIISKDFFTAEQQSARCWLSPCPNLTDIFTRINQIADSINKTTLGKKHEN